VGAGTSVRVGACVWVCGCVVVGAVTVTDARVGLMFLPQTPTNLSWFSLTKRHWHAVVYFCGAHWHAVVYFSGSHWHAVV